MSLLKIFLGGTVLIITIGFADMLVNGELLIWHIITGVPEYVSKFIMLGYGLVPSWVMGIVLMAAAISLALLIVKIFNHLTSPLS